GRRTIKDSPNRAEASKAEAAKLGVQVKDLFFTPGGPHDAAIVIEAEGPEPIHKFMANIHSLGNVKMKFIRPFSIDHMLKIVKSVAPEKFAASLNEAPLKVVVGRGPEMFFFR